MYSEEEISRLVTFIGELIVLGIWWSDAFEIGVHYLDMKLNEEEIEEINDRVNVYTSKRKITPPPCRLGIW